MGQFSLSVQECSQTHRLGKTALVQVWPVSGWHPLQCSLVPAHGARGTGHHLRVGDGWPRVVRPQLVVRMLGQGVERVLGVVVAAGSGGRVAGRGQTKGLLQKQVHLLSHLVDGGL